MYDKETMVGRAQIHLYLCLEANQYQEREKRITGNAMRYSYFGKSCAHPNNEMEDGSNPSQSYCRHVEIKESNTSGIIFPGTFS